MADSTNIIGYVLDTETSLNNQPGQTSNPVGKFMAHPACPDNWIVWLGIAPITAGINLSMPATQKFERGRIDIHPPTGAKFLVGHNLAFDLAYLCNPTNDAWAEWRALLLDPEFRIWDTMLAEYRLLGQAANGLSLDDCCIRRGWTTKPGNMKDYWNKGIGTELIPDEEVEPYLRHDVNLTGQLFRDQVSQANAEGMMELMRIDMDARITTLVMELNGMCFDTKKADEYLRTVIQPQLQGAEAHAIDHGMMLTKLPREAVRPTSPSWLKAFLYGGTIKWTVKEPCFDANGDPILFKSGKKKGEQKLKNVEKQHTFAVGASPIPFPGTDADTLKTIRDLPKTDKYLAAFLDWVLKFRDLQKQDGTYFKGYSDLTWDDGFIHASLKHTATATGRLSCRDPNLQNAGHSPIREAFVSRHRDGKLMEVDLSQIEVVVQAFLSSDAAMISDIIAGVDFHCKRAALAKHEKYEDVLEWCNEKTTKHTNPALYEKWTKIRKKAKIISFQKAYGAGPKKIAETTGLSMNEVKSFLAAEDAAYPNVKATQEEWIEEVEKSARIIYGAVTGVLKSPVNVKYHFQQEEYNGHKTFKPTCIKNYPIQGFSADILKIILAGLRKVVDEYYYQNSQEGDEYIQLVMTVHDSVVLDVPSWVDVEHLGKHLKEYFTTEPLAVLKNTFGVNFDVPISADVDVGVTWAKMETLEID